MKNGCGRRRGPTLLDGALILAWWAALGSLAFVRNGLVGVYERTGIALPEMTLLLARVPTYVFFGLAGLMTALVLGGAALLGEKRAAVFQRLQFALIPIVWIASVHLLYLPMKSSGLRGLGPAGARPDSLAGGRASVEEGWGKPADRDAEAPHELIDRLDAEDPVLRRRSAAKKLARRWSVWRGRAVRRG